MFSLNWTVLDLLRTALDRTAVDGHLPVQDDLGADITPFAVLLRRAERLGVEVHDLRQRPRSGRGKAQGTRKIEQVKGLCLHQMAALIDDPEQCLGIPAHGSVLLGGDIVLMHPLRAYLYAAHAFNADTISIEVAGRCAGVKGEPKTFWRSKKEINGWTDRRGRRVPPKSYAELVREPTAKQIAAANLLSDYYVTEAERQGAEMETQDFHRGGHSSRVSDPGSELALGVGLPVSQRHGLAYATRTKGSGKKTPTAWGGKPGVPFSWRFRGY